MCCISLRSEKDYFVSQNMKRVYGGPKGFPDCFPQRSKTLLLFQVCSTTLNASNNFRVFSCLKVTVSSVLSLVLVILPAGG